MISLLLFKMVLSLIPKRDINHTYQGDNSYVSPLYSWRIADKPSNTNHLFGTAQLVILLFVSKKCYREYILKVWYHIKIIFRRPDIVNLNSLKKVDILKLHHFYFYFLVKLPWLWTCKLHILYRPCSCELFILKTY